MLIYNKPISNVELEQICYNKSIPNVKVIMNDELVIVPETFYIINLNNTGQSGTHWVCLYCGINICFYMDSFGCVPTKNIHNKLLDYYSEIHYNAFIIQYIKSQMCGYFCLGLIFTLEDKIETEIISYANAYINIFNDNSKLNNAILKDYMKQF